MKKFIVLYHASPDAMAEMSNEPPSEEAMKPWMDWAKKCGSKLVDLGNPLFGGVKLSPDGKSTESKKGVVGYSVLQANDLEDAKSLLKGHPHLGWHGGCDIELHEAMAM